MFFTNLALLGGLTALAIPVLIHLLLKRKKQRLRFSTLQFFAKQDEQSTRRRKLRNWLLLAARILLLTLIVLAFARPYLPNQLSGAAKERRQIVFVLDRSASMQATDANGFRWNRAKSSIEKVLSELQSEDRVALIGCSTRADVLSPLAPADEIKSILKNLAPDSGTAELGYGLQQAVKFLSNKNSGEQSIIYVVSDLQQSSARRISLHQIPQSIELKLLNVGEVYTPNIAVTKLQLEPEGSSKPHAVVGNFSDEIAKVKTSLLLDGKEFFTRQTELKPDHFTQIDLEIPALEPGWHSCEYRIQSDDVLALDDSRYEVIYVPQPARVLIVEPRSVQRAFEEESFFIASALAPSKAISGISLPRFSVDKIPASQLLANLAEQKTGARYDFVVLPGLREIPSGASRALSEFVKNGGALLLFLGDGISANRYNSEFRDLLPAQLGRTEEDFLNWHLQEFQKTSPIFAAFQRPNSGNLNLPTFTRRFTLTTKENSRVLARFDDGMPFIIEHPTAKIILVNTSADTRWNDWPKHKTFVPWLHGVGNYLAGNAKAEMKTHSNFIASDDAEIDLGALAKKRTFRVQRIGGKEFTTIANDDGSLRSLNFSTPGIYTIRDEANQEIQKLAVNFPREESDLSAMTTNQFHQQLVRSSDAIQPVAAASLFGRQNSDKELWRILLLAGLALLVLELVLANRTFA